jgi:hypothetical protein
MRYDNAVWGILITVYMKITLAVIFQDQDVGWVDNIKTDLREIGWDGTDWIDLAQDRDQWRALVITVMNLLVP